MADKKALTVSILGRSYSIVTDENSAVVEQAAQYVDGLLHKMLGSAQAPPAEVMKKTRELMDVVMQRYKDL